MKSKTFVQQVAALFRGNLVHAFSQFGVITLLSVIGDSGAAGTYVLALAMTAPIFMFCDLNLRVARSTDHKYQEEYSSYLGLRSYAIIVAIVATLLICCMFYPERLTIIVPILIYRCGESFSNLAYGGLQRMQSSHLIGTSLTQKGLSALVLLGILIPVSGGNPIVAASGMALISIFWAIFRDLPLAWKINVPEATLGFDTVVKGMSDLNSCRRIAFRALPLGFDAGISSLALNIPKYCIEAYCGTATFTGTEALGVFGVLSHLAFSIQKLIGAIGHTGVGVLAKQRSEGNRASFWRLFNKLLVTSVLVGIAAIIGGMIVIPLLMGWLLGPEYGDYGLIFTLLLASGLTGAQRIAGRATQACGQYFAYTMFDVIIFLTSAITSVTLVKQYGSVGAGIAISLAFAVGLSATLFHTYKMLWPLDENETIPALAENNNTTAG